MRQRASIITAMEGMARPVFQIAKELSLNSRAGLTSRFLSKKLELPQEEVEYLVDINHKLLYLDITKIKLPPEGINAVKRIVEITLTDEPLPRTPIRKVMRGHIRDSYDFDLAAWERSWNTFLDESATPADDPESEQEPEAEPVG